MLNFVTISKVGQRSRSYIFVYLKSSSHKVYTYKFLKCYQFAAYTHMHTQMHTHSHKGTITQYELQSLVPLYQKQSAGRILFLCFNSITRQRIFLFRFCFAFVFLVSFFVCIKLLKHLFALIWKHQACQLYHPRDIQQFVLLFCILQVCLVLQTFENGKCYKILNTNCLCKKLYKQCRPRSGCF